jgi:Fe/S biogenesis protein NfuA
MTATGIDAAAGSTTDGILTITPAALETINELRSSEPDGEHLGLKVEIVDRTGPEFRYDLFFETVTKAAITDVIRNHDGLKVIVPAADVDDLEGAVLDHELGQLVMRNPNRPAAIQLGTLVTTDDLALAVRSIVDEQVNPALAAHGGYVTFIGHDGDGKAYLTMGGGCHGCSMSRMTMLQGVQTMIMEAVPTITKVVDATDHSTGENPYYT